MCCFQHLRQWLSRFFIYEISWYICISLTGNTHGNSNQILIMWETQSVCKCILNWLCIWSWLTRDINPIFSTSIETFPISFLDLKSSYTDQMMLQIIPWRLYTLVPIVFPFLINILSEIYRDWQSKSILKRLQPPPKGACEENFYKEVSR